MTEFFTTIIYKCWAGLLYNNRNFTCISIYAEDTIYLMSTLVVFKSKTAAIIIPCKTRKIILFLKKLSWNLNVLVCPNIKKLWTLKIQFVSRFQVISRN